MPQITGGELDGDDDADADPVPAATRLAYVGAADAVLAALQADKGLSAAEINKYLPVVETALTAAAGVVPGAGPVIGAILKVVPKQI